MKPRGLDTLLQWIAPPEIKSYYEFVEKSVEDRTKLEENLQDGSTDKKNMRKDIFHYLFQSKDPDTGEKSYSPDELWSEANLLIIAGSSTTSTILSALLFYLAHNSRSYKRLAAEIRTMFERTDDIRWGPSLNSCHYLRACLNETFRMSPAGPSELSREVLPGGYTVDGVFYPEGTQIGISGWAINYNEQYFPDCNSYRPERWIVDEEDGFTADQVACAHSALFPFSSGPDTCVGKNLAWRELMITTGRLLYRMDVRLPPGADVGGGAPELGWGRRNKYQYLLRDAWVSLRNGPLLQFKQVEH